MPQTPAGNGDRGAGDKPAPGFTFADKRKIKPTATGAAEPDASSAADEGDLTSATAEESLLADLDAAEVVADPAFEQALAAESLAAERLVDLQRLQAEYANYRKRVDRDRDVARESTIASVIDSLLPVLDDIHLARQHGDLESGPFVSIAEKLENTLSRYGVERYGEPGAAFDPSIHDALMHVEAELAEGTDVTTVVGVLQPGYRLGEKIIRPARVSVADPS